MDLSFLQSLVKPADTKIVLLVIDGLGGLPREQDGKTELEAAPTPHLDELAARSVCGLQQAIGPGITPGSGPAHLALFGYDPVRYQVGRGVLSALGIGFDLRPADVAARGNFCTIDEDGNITDRRAGRISTEVNQELCKILRRIEMPGAEIFVEPVKEYRFLLVLRGEGLSGELADTDPQVTGKPVRQARALAAASGTDVAAEETVRLVNEFQKRARQALAGRERANMVMLRGFSQLPQWPTYPQELGLRAAAIAAYPMYRGVARLLGMEVLQTGTTIEDEFATLAEQWHHHDFFYLHVKPTDSAGEDGDFERKAGVIAQTDSLLPRLLALDPDVIAVTGDHSTPAAMRYHSWHPVPVLLWSRWCRPDAVKSFGERACQAGGLGPRLPAVDLLPLMLANGGRLEKYGA